MALVFIFKQLKPAVTRMSNRSENFYNPLFEKFKKNLKIYNKKKILALTEM